MCFCVWSLWFAYFLNSCICCREVSQKKKRKKKSERKMEQYGFWVWQSRSWTFHMTTVREAERTTLFLCKHSQRCFCFFLFPVKHTDTFHYSAGCQRKMVWETLTSLQKWGIPLLSVKWSCWKKRRRSRAGPWLWFEVIPSHESGTSSSSPSGKTDRARPHEDNYVLPVIFCQRQLPCRGEKQFLWVTCK